MNLLLWSIGRHSSVALGTQARCPCAPPVGLFPSCRTETLRPLLNMAPQSLRSPLHLPPTLCQSENGGLHSSGIQCVLCGRLSAACVRLSCCNAQGHSPEWLNHACVCSLSLITDSPPTHTCDLGSAGSKGPTFDSFKYKYKNPEAKR